MDLALTESQQMLRNTARSVIEREAPKEVLVAAQGSETGLQADWWRTAAEIGWLGMLIPAEYGGGGSSLTDAAVLFEELGRGPLPGPFFSSMVLGALCLLEAGTDEQKRRLLPGVAAGDTVLTVALSDPRSSWGPQGVSLRPERCNGSYVLNGAKLFVGDAAAATHVITAVRSSEAAEDVRLLLVDTRLPGVSARTLPGF